jgi:hypothetical protein
MITISIRKCELHSNSHFKCAAGSNVEPDMLENGFFRSFEQLRLFADSRSPGYRDRTVLTPTSVDLSPRNVLLSAVLPVLG